MKKLVFVGLGWWGMELAKAAAKLPAHVKIAGGFALSREEMSTFETWFAAPTYGSFVDVLRDPAVDGVVLSTPHSLHAGQILEVARAGKHVFVEKPLALSVDDAITAEACCAEHKVVLAVGHNRRFSSAAQHLARWLAGDRFGQVLHVEAHFSGNSAMNFTPETWRASRIESPNGSLVSIGLHMIDTIQFMLGPIGRVSCLSKRQALGVDIDDTTAALMELESGITGNFATLFATPLNSHFRIYGTRGIAQASGDFTELSWIDEDQSREDIELDPVDTLVAELEAFCGACEGVAPYPVAPHEAVRNVAVIEAMTNSARQNGAWMPIRS